MRYVGHLMKFEDENMALYETAPNSTTAASAPEPVQQVQNPVQQAGPVDEFDTSQSEFL